MKDVTFSAEIHHPVTFLAPTSDEFGYCQFFGLIQEPNEDVSDVFSIEFYHDNYLDELYELLSKMPKEGAWIVEAKGYLGYDESGTVLRSHAIRVYTTIKSIDNLPLVYTFDDRPNVAWPETEEDCSK